MAVISELIDVGLKLKAGGKRQAAIEHFRQLHATYPGNARIMFELAQAWGAFGSPERALPLYQELLALPKGQDLPARDKPRLYARLTATLYRLGDYDAALETVEEGLGAFPSYRPLRAFRIFSLQAADRPQRALIEALNLMMESLAPSRWDSLEGEILEIVGELRAATADDGKSGQSKMGLMSADRVMPNAEEPSASDPRGSSERRKISVARAEEAGEDLELKVSLVRKPEQRPSGKQFGKRAVRIDISAPGDREDNLPDDENKPDAPAGKLSIPIDLD